MTLGSPRVSVNAAAGDQATIQLQQLQVGLLLNLYNCCPSARLQDLVCPLMLALCCTGKCHSTPSCQAMCVMHMCMPHTILQVQECKHHWVIGIFQDGIRQDMTCG